MNRYILYKQPGVLFRSFNERSVKYGQDLIMILITENWKDEETNESLTYL